MTSDETNSPKQQPSSSSEKSVSNRPWWLIGGLLALGAVMLTCLAAIGIGFFVLRSTDRSVPAPQTVVQPAAPTPTERPADGTSPATPAPTASAALVSSGRIAFIDPDGRIGTVAPEGTDTRLLSDAGWRYQFPAWSPDGRQIAAIGSNGEQGAVRVFSDELAAKETEVYGSRTQSPFYLYWSPDGRQVSFLANARRGIGLWLAPADGQTEARLLASGQPFYWDWAADSTQLLVHSGTLGDDARLGFIDTNGDASGDTIAEPGLFQAPGLSSDGRFVAFAGAQDEDLRVVVEDRQTGERVSVEHTGLVALSWSPTENLLAFTSPRTPQAAFIGPLRLLDATTGETQVLVNDAVAGFFWSPDGRSIAYLTLESGSTSPGASRPSGLAAVAGSRNLQQDHPDIRLKLWVVDVADGKQRLLTSFKPTGLFVTQFLPFFDQYALSHRIWSPAGDAIVLPMVEAGGREAVYVVPTDGRALQRLVDGSMAFWSQ